MVHAGPAVARPAKPTATKEVDMKRMLYCLVAESSRHTGMVNSISRDANRLIAKE